MFENSTQGTLVDVVVSFSGRSVPVGAPYLHEPSTVVPALLVYPISTTNLSPATVVYDTVTVSPLAYAAFLKVALLTNSPDANP